MFIKNINYKKLYKYIYIQIRKYTYKKIIKNIIRKIVSTIFFICFSVAFGNSRPYKALLKSSAIAVSGGKASLDVSI